MCPNHVTVCDMKVCAWWIMVCTIIIGNYYINNIFFVWCINRNGFISFTGLSLKYLAVDLQSSSWNIDTTVGIDKHVFSPTSAKYE